MQNEFFFYITAGDSCHVGLIYFHRALMYPPGAYESRLHFSQFGDRCGHAATFETAGGHS